MGSPKDLNQPSIYAEALVRAAMEDDTLRLAVWLSEDEQVTQNPFWKWYAYFAEKLRDMAPRPEFGFQGRNKRNIPAPKIGRNDVCPCGSGKKYKQCHGNLALQGDIGRNEPCPCGSGTKFKHCHGALSGNG